MYRVVVLQAGYSVVQADGSMRANGTSTLVVGGEHRVVVDTLSPWDRWVDWAWLQNAWEPGSLAQCLLAGTF